MKNMVLIRELLSEVQIEAIKRLQEIGEGELLLNGDVLEDVLENEDKSFEV